MLAVWTMVVLLVFLLTAWWDRERWITGRVFHFCSQLAVWLNPYWTVHYEGAFPSRSDHPFVAVSNHESLADPVVVGPLPWQMRWLSKASNFRIPFIGWMMTFAGEIKVRRGDAASRAASFSELREALDAGMSVMLFPEGTRSKTADMLPFYDGAFRLALEAGVPVVPIVIRGSRAALIGGTAYFRRAYITVEVLDPISVEGMAIGDVEVLRDRARDAIDARR